MTASRFRGIFRPGVDPFSAAYKPPLPPADYDRRTEQGLLIERNCVIPLADGTKIYCDIYRREEGVMLPFPLHEQTRNRGMHVFRTGGTYDSRLLVPAVPVKEG